jgi:hypothetical protein
MPELLTATEAARLIGVSERTMRAWLKAGRVPGAVKTAPPREPARWQIPEDSARALLHLPEGTGSAGALSERLADMERRIEQLEALMQPSRAAPRAAEETHRTIPEGIPEGLDGVTDWCRAHGVPETTLKHAVEAARLTVVSGRWKVGRAYVLHALDEAGHRQAYELWGRRETFRRCSRCPGGLNVES